MATGQHDGPVSTVAPPFWARAGRWSRRNRAILVLVAATMVGRAFLAPWNSYWLDELYSVALFGVWQDSLVDVAIALRESSIHPPLYQWILSIWMGVFGGSELATRSLSSLYVGLGTLLVHRTMRLAWSKRMALLTAFMFSKAGLSVRYRLETRSYAQTLFFAAMSSHALLLLACP